MKVLTIFSFIIQIAVCQYDTRVITSLKYSKYRYNRVSPKIVQGNPANSFQVPYLVSLKQPDDSYSVGQTLWRNICGGSIIDSKRVLTAAHCFESNDFYFAKNPRVLRCVAGNINNTLRHSGATETTADGQWRSLKKVLLHKEFFFPMNDIALAYVNLPWVFTNNVQSIKMASKDMDYTSYCTAAGYGRVGPSLRDAISEVLLVAQIMVLPKLQCSALWDMNMNNFICSDTEFTDVARGDSGGPLVCKYSGYSEGKVGEKILVGVVSGQNVDKTSLFTRISSYRSWIDNNDAGKLFVNSWLTVILAITIYLSFYDAFVCLYAYYMVTS